MDKVNFIGVTVALAAVFMLLAEAVPEYAHLVAGIAPSAGALFLSLCLKRRWFGMGLPDPDGGLEVHLDVIEEDGERHHVEGREALGWLTERISTLEHRAQHTREAAVQAASASFRQGYNQGVLDSAEDKCLPEQRTEEYLDWLLDRPTQH